MSHVKQYTRSDGTTVQSHEDKRTKKHELITHDKAPKPYDDTESEHTVKGREKEHGTKVKLTDHRMLAHQEYMAGVMQRQRETQHLISVELPPEETGFGDEVSHHIKSRMEAEKTETTTKQGEKNEPRTEKTGTAKENNKGTERRGVTGHHEEPQPYTRTSGESGRGLGLHVTASYIPSEATKKRYEGYNCPVFHELDAEGAELFAKTLEAFKITKSDTGASVYVYPVEDYKKMRLFISEDKKAGVAVKSDGDIVSVFSQNRSGHAIMELAIQNGGKKLDCFDTYLPEFYSKHGFIAVARNKWNDEYMPDGWDKKFYDKFNNGEPDVVFMVYDKNGNKSYTPDQGELIAGDNAYEKGLELQSNYLKKDAGDEKKEKPVKDEKPLAPNGKPSKLNAVQYEQVNTPEFKKWFGDSQVKDENGDPLVVYHGTDADISEFKETPSKTGHPSAKLGYFFTASPHIADRFNRESAGEFSDPAKQPYSKGANIASVFLSIENMKTLSARDYRDLMGDLDSEPTEEYGWTRTPENWLALKNKWVKEGFDGLCVLADKNANDPGLEEYGADQYVAFNSNQIKSAIGNKGSFKRDDVDITKSFGLPPILTTDAWWSQ